MAEFLLPINFISKQAKQKRKKRKTMRKMKFQLSVSRFLRLFCVDTLGSSLEHIFVIVCMYICKKYFYLSIFFLLFFVFENLRYPYTLSCNVRVPFDKFWLIFIDVNLRRRTSNVSSRLIFIFAIMGISTADTTLYTRTNDYGLICSESLTLQTF